MSIPFTRNGKLDDTYDTKDSVFTLYTKITASGASMTSSGIYLDKELTKAVTNGSPIKDASFLNYLYSGKVIIEAIHDTGSGSITSYWRSAVTSFFSAIGLEKPISNTDADGNVYHYTLKAASGLDASTGSGLGSFVSYDIFVSAD